MVVNICAGKRKSFPRYPHSSATIYRRFVHIANARKIFYGKIFIEKNIILKPASGISMTKKTCRTGASSNVGNMD
jgi:hypothetical protein